MHHGNGAADGGIKRVFELRALEFQFVNFLVGGEFDFLLESADAVVQLMVFLEHLAEPVVTQPQVADGFAMFGEFAHERVMDVHWNSSG